MSAAGPLLAGKRAVVTGAATESGIGFATALLFAEHGAKVALLDIDGAAVAARARALGPGHHAFACDVAWRGACEQAVADAAHALGGLDILVNVAGLVHGAPLMEITEAEYDTVLDVNLKGSFNMARAAAPLIRDAGGGAMVLMSSIASENGGGVFGRSHYAAAKAGIFGRAKAPARELATDGIRVNAVAPGPVDNDFTKGAMTREIKDRIAQGVPLGRLGRSDEIAGVCLFLASGLSSFVTGTGIDANGGLLIH
ncbi:MAG: SDR family NAD(P)-dependent oxidoreductase [Rhodospirillaceae bacterium]